LPGILIFQIFFTLKLMKKTAVEKCEILCPKVVWNRVNRYTAFSVASGSSTQMATSQDRRMVDRVSISGRCSGLTPAQFPQRLIHPAGH